MVGAVVAYTSQEHPLNGAKSTRPHHKHISIQILNCFTNLLLWISYKNMGSDLTGEVEFGANSEGVIEYGVGDALLVRFNGCSESRNFEITGATEGDGTGIEASGDGGRGLDVEDGEGRSIGGIGCRGSELEVVQCPTQRVHAFLAAIHSYQHATKVSSTRHLYQVWFLRCVCRVRFWPMMIVVSLSPLSFSLTLLALLMFNIFRMILLLFAFLSLSLSFVFISLIFHDYYLLFVK